MPRGFFVTGTDTGVGKTLVSAALARLLRTRGVNVGVMKPVTSGCREESGELFSDDARLLCYAGRVDCLPDVAPYRLREPIVPADAARIDGERIDFRVIRDAFSRLSSGHDCMIVEGAGGLMVPLADDLLVADLARGLGLPLLVVARPNLGTINHTVLTCRMARQLGLPLAGVIINRMPASPGLAEQAAPRWIGSLCDAPLLGVWPECSTRDEQGMVEELAGWLDKQPQTDGLLRELRV